MSGDSSRIVAKDLLDMYFKTMPYPFTGHHIESYDQFLMEGIPSILKGKNPVTLVKERLGQTGEYKYKIELYFGGVEGTGISIGTPTVSLQQTKEIRVLFPNEARLRNLTYASSLLVDLMIRVTVLDVNPKKEIYQRLVQELRFDAMGSWEKFILSADGKTEKDFRRIEEGDFRIPLGQLPIMLHSRFCSLNGKPKEFLREVGECEYDYGGYFIIDGAEKVIVTVQESAFNTLYLTMKDTDPEFKIKGNLYSMSPITRDVKGISLYLNRKDETIHVTLPFVRLPVPICVLFRAMGVESDRDIYNAIFPDPESDEARLLSPLLLPSFAEALPFTDRFMSIQFLKMLTKGFSEAHVLDILENQIFIHMENMPGARTTFLGYCVRMMLRVAAGIDQPTNRDDTRNQRCMTSGFLAQKLFFDIYREYLKRCSLAIDREFESKKSSEAYANEKFVSLFVRANHSTLFNPSFITDGLMRAFKGRWGTGLGEEKSGTLQGLSRLSYHDFLSHCRRVVLEFDTTLKLPAPRHLHPSQYGYYCTNETPTGASIGITKNLSILTQISTGTPPTPLLKWLYTKGGVLTCASVNLDVKRATVPVFVNNGMIGYTQTPKKLRDVLKLLKWTGCLPAFASVGFSIRDRMVFIFLDEGRPLRPLIHLPLDESKLKSGRSWRDLVLGTLEQTKERMIYSTGFVDPLQQEPTARLERYLEYLRPFAGIIEYIDPYEQNEIFIANYPETITKDSSHLEIHPSTILGLMVNMIPFPQHNQSPRNQLSCSQSKQGLSVYSTQFPNRFDNQSHVLCYGEAPLTRTLYYDYVADGMIGYGTNLVLAIGSFTGYNQDDGILMNRDSLERGMFRSMAYRSYEAFEEDDEKSDTQTRIANPTNVLGWTDLRAGVDYSKLDDRGIIKVGEFVDQNTVIVGRYLRTKLGTYSDASITPQVWTSGRVEKIAVTVSNKGLRLIKIRVVHDRIPELGDKFSNRHGQKGTIGMAIPGCDMPRTIEGVVPDMIMNPHAIPSRMTIAQLLETIFGKVAARTGAIANATAFTNDGDPSVEMGKLLEQFGMEKYGNEILYDGTTGVQIPSMIFIGHCYTMRLKHMTQDKWNARAEGRKEQKTHQPTGGRGNEGGLRIGEMEACAIEAHGTSLFFRESLMQRSDGTTFVVCNGCGTIPIYNAAQKLYVCPLCDGPVDFDGVDSNSAYLIPPNKRSMATFSKIEIPYAMKVLSQELASYMNVGLRLLTNQTIQRLERPTDLEISDTERQTLLLKTIPQYTLPEPEEDQEARVKREEEAKKEDEKLTAALDALTAMGMTAPPIVEVGEPLSAALDRTDAAQPVPSQPPIAQQMTVVTQAVPSLAPMAQPPPAPSPPPMTTVPSPPPMTQPMTVAPMSAAPNATVPQAMAAQPMPAPTQIGGQMYMPVYSQQTYVPVMAANVLPPPVPGGPPTLIVDTSPEAMEASGLDTPDQPPPPVRNSRQPRSRSPSPRRFEPPQPQPQQQSSNVKVFVQKLG
jgi:DNA-directed RNA polymerase II subunit RPB2